MVSKIIKFKMSESVMSKVIVQFGDAYMIIVVSNYPEHYETWFNKILKQSKVVLCIAILWP